MLIDMLPRHRQGNILGSSLIASPRRSRSLSSRSAGECAWRGPSVAELEAVEVPVLEVEGRRLPMPEMQAVEPPATEMQAWQPPMIDAEAMMTQSQKEDVIAEVR